MGDRDEPGPPPGDDDHAEVRELPRGVVGLVGAWAVAVALAVVVLLVAVALMSGDDEPVPGLGVEEPIEVAVTDDSVVIDASVVPRTWGTEVLLSMTGLEDGRRYWVELEAADGTRVSAGTLIGDADLEVVCVMNGALLREDVAAVVIEAEPGAPLMRAELDPVDDRSLSTVAA